MFDCSIFSYSVSWIGARRFSEMYKYYMRSCVFFFFQAEDGIRDKLVTGVQTCALPICGTISVAASASDNVGVVGVQFKLDGANLGGESTTAPYAVSWTTTTGTNGTHTLTAVARDAAGNSATSPAVTVTVSNVVSPPPSPSRSPYKGVPFAVPGVIEAEDFDNGGEGVAYHDLTPGNQGGQYRTDVDVDIIAVLGNATGYVVNSFQTGEWLTYTINVTQAGIYRIEANVSSLYSTSSWHAEIDGVNVTGSIAVPNTGWWGTFQWSGASGVNLTAGQHILAIVSDQQYFNLDAIRISLVNSDTTPPTVSLTAPAAGATVSGTTTAAASAGDSVGEVGVQFTLDGANLGAENTTAPYAVSWTTTTATNGSHTLTAVARDAAGNSTTSAAVTVTVSNDAIPPTVSLTAPAAGAIVTGTIAVAATASDNVGVVGVQFTLDGANLGAERTTAPYAVSWDTTIATNGTHTLTAVARDAAGNSTTSAAVTVTVGNDATPPTVSLTAPTPGATVTGTTTVSASATDNVDRDGVELGIGGALRGGGRTTKH